MDTSSVLSDEDYDVISIPGQRSLESSIADLSVREIPPTQAACKTLSTASLSPTDIQTWVRGVIDAANGRSGSSYPHEHRTVRVYLDGVFDTLTAGCVRTQFAMNHDQYGPLTRSRWTVDTCCSSVKPSSLSPLCTSWWESFQTNLVTNTIRSPNFLTWSAVSSCAIVAGSMRSFRTRCGHSTTHSSSRSALTMWCSRKVPLSTPNSTRRG